MKKVAVFGGSGFLGSYLVNELLQRKYDVYSLDLEPSSFNEEAVFIQADIMDKNHINELFKEHQFDVVYNLAGFANLDKAVEYPLETFNLNVIGNLHLIEASKLNGVSRFVYASSAYAMSEKGSFYGISKLSSEKIIEEYYKQFDFAYTILRYGSIYSERDFENNYIFNLIKDAIESNEIRHKGDGNEIREYIHANDAAKLSVDVIEDDKYIGKHLILTGVERMKRIELFNLINEILGDKISIRLDNDGYQHHYKYSPYSFTAQESQKLVPNPYIDMGQGILNCIKEVHNK